MTQMEYLNQLNSNKEMEMRNKLTKIFNQLIGDGLIN